MPSRLIYFNLAFNLISVPAKATDTGQVFFVCSANSLNFAWSMPGTCASVVSCGTCVAVPYVPAVPVFLSVTAPVDAQARPLKEKAWELRLNEGWKLEPGERKGDYRVVKAAK